MTTISVIDPLCPASGGRYDDALVVVEVGGPDAVRASRLADGRVLIRHRLDEAVLDDDLAEQLAEQLGSLIGDHEVFARAFTGIVLTSATDPVEAWERFYRNSLNRIIDQRRDGYAGVYRHALQLLPRTSVLDLGCGFGFLSLRLAALGTRVIACDVDNGTIRLLRRLCDRLRQRVSVVPALDGRVPVGSSSVDAVAMLHVLEHVEPADGHALLAEAMRVARRRVVVAVPYEEQPSSLYGHVRRFRASDLGELGAASGWTYEVHDHLGGWLVLDRPVLRTPRAPTLMRTVPKENGNGSHNR